MVFIYPFLSLLMVFGAYAASQSVSSNFSQFWFPFFFFQELTASMLFLVTLLFFSKRLSLKYQKFQMLILLLSAPKMSFDMTLFFLVKTKMDFPAFPFFNTLIFYILGSIFIFGLSLLRAYRLLQKGEFKENGRGLMGKQYGERVNSFSSMFGVIFPIVILGGLVMSFLGNMGQDIVILSVMLVMSFLMYTVVSTEYIFVFYCKLRFPSFNITETEQIRIDKEAGLLKAQLKQFDMEEKKEVRRQKLEKKKKDQ